MKHSSFSFSYPLAFVTLAVSFSHVNRAFHLMLTADADFTADLESYLSFVAKG
jgi:hypothetical protein